MTLKPNTDNGLQGRMTEHQLPTAVLRNGGSSASYDSFELRNPLLRKAAKR